MQINARILDNGLLWCNEHRCKYFKICANHASAGDKLDEKISPSIYIDFDGKIFCYTIKQKMRKNEFDTQKYPESPYDCEFGPLRFDPDEKNILKGPHSI